MQNYSKNRPNNVKLTLWLLLKIVNREAPQLKNFYAFS